MTFFAVCTPSINSNTCVLERRNARTRKRKWGKCRRGRWNGKMVHQQDRATTHAPTHSHGTQTHSHATPTLSHGTLNHSHGTPTHSHGTPTHPHGTPTPSKHEHATQCQYEIPVHIHARGFPVSHKLPVAHNLEQKRPQRVRRHLGSSSSKDSMREHVLQCVCFATFVDGLAPNWARIV